MRHIQRFLGIVCGLSAIVWCATVFADAPADPGTDPSGALNQLWQAVVSKRYGLAAVIATMLFVAFARFIAPRIHGKLGLWVNSTRVSAALALVGGMSSAIAWKLMAGTPWSANILVYGFGIGVAAIGGYNAFWDLLFPADKKIAASAAANSAAELAKKTPPVVLVLILSALAISSCAHTGYKTDTLRQGCSFADLALTQTVATATSVYKQTQHDLRMNVTPMNVPATQKKHDAVDAAFDKFRADTKAAVAVKRTICDAADLIDSGGTGDPGTLSAQVTKLVQNLALSFRAFQDAIEANSSTKPSALVERSVM